MARPFRFEAPSVSEHAIERPALVQRLGHRWQRRVVTVVAGPGFGKTCLLVAAMQQAPPTGHRDVWLCCEPADESGEHLLSAIAVALALDPRSDLERVLEAVWTEAPRQVCLVFDDIHEIAPGSSGAELLSRLTTELAANGHLVFSSRDTVPVPLARLASQGELVRISESDLLFEPAELDAIASFRKVDRGLLDSTGGWPALVELTVTAGSELVLDYLLEEVLKQLGPDRARLLAAFSAVGGGDDVVASAVAGRPVTVEDVVASVPLVQRTDGGWAALHPLWAPALRRMLTGEGAALARRRAAHAHSRAGRFEACVQLAIDAEDWSEVLAAIVDAEKRASSLQPSEFGRWRRALPESLRGEPEALLAEGLELRSRTPRACIASFERAAELFRARGDVDGEIAAHWQNGLLRWWLNDVAGMLALHGRIRELAENGSIRARTVAAVGSAGIAHIFGDSAGVLGALEDITGSDEAKDWRRQVAWLGSVAHRRNGDLQRAHEELDHPELVAIGDADPQIDIARSRIHWLEGRVDQVAEEFRTHHETYRRTGERHLSREAGLESAAKHAWLGELRVAEEGLAAEGSTTPDLSNALTVVLEAIARAAVAVGHGDEATAAAHLRQALDKSAAPIDGPFGWYWRDRAAIPLTSILVPETRLLWTSTQLGPAHQAGRVLADALDAARNGEFRSLRRVAWPESGLIRAHLPYRWVAELAAAALAAGNPLPGGLLVSMGNTARATVAELAETHPDRRVARAASNLLRDLPAAPRYRVRIEVLGSVRVLHDGVDCVASELRRGRVRQLLCYLAAHGRVRREAAGSDLWPELDDPSHNLAVTLNYLQRVLQPERAKGENPFFLRTEGEWLELAGDGVDVDVRDLLAGLDSAEAAERTGQLRVALEAYRAMLVLWRGEPFADAPYADWAEPHRARLRARYVEAAVRTGELLLASRHSGDARKAAEHALYADPTSEPAYRLLARTHVADGNSSAARRSLEMCLDMLAELGVGPDAATKSLSASLLELFDRS